MPLLSLPSPRIERFCRDDYRFNTSAKPNRAVRVPRVNPAPSHKCSELIRDPTDETTQWRCTTRKKLPCKIQTNLIPFCRPSHHFWNHIRPTSSASPHYRFPSLPAHFPLQARIHCPSSTGGSPLLYEIHCGEKSCCLLDPRRGHGGTAIRS